LENINNKFEQQLNRHGYGFQYTVLELLKKLANEGRSNWLFEAAEFPVEVQGVGTQIDFILRYRTTQLFILAECKRVDPKFNNWCFVKAPYVRRNRNYESYFVDHVEYNYNEFFPENSCLITGEELITPVTEYRTYHIGFIVKSHNIKGESGKTENDAIEKATTQICRGLNGLIELLSKRPSLIKKEEKNNIINSGATFLPVIFTTAKIFTCDHDISLANIEDGKLDLYDEKIVTKDWILYQYHISPNIKHLCKPGQITNKFAEVLDQEYVRTIAIVSVEGINDFMKYFDSIF